MSGASSLPQISVIMSVYNGAAHLHEAINSILNQFFADFEFIIVDDASNDATASILAQYQEKDNRVRILTNVVNKERSYSRNWAIGESRAPLIAIMDADDWAHPARLEVQSAFMRDNPEVTACGSWFAGYETGELWKWPCTHAEICVLMLFNSMIAHPSAMIRKDALEKVKGYDVEIPSAEDYDLWVRLAKQPCVRFANIPSVLLRYRVYPGSDRTSYHAKQMFASDLIRCSLLQHVGLIPSQEQLRHHRILGGVEPAQGIKDIVSALTWKRALLNANETAKFCDQDTLKSFLRNALVKMCCRMGRNLLVKMWRAVMPQCIRKQYSHLKILMRKVK